MIQVSTEDVRSRDLACKIAREDPAKALEIARRVGNAWYRAQALAAVARHIGKDRVEKIAAEALECAARCPDEYQRVAASAWPIRALCERGYRARARSTILALRTKFAYIEPEASKAEAVLLLFQSGFCLGSRVREMLLGDLLSLVKPDAHWRAKTNLIRAIDMLQATDPAYAQDLAQNIPDPKTRRKALLLAEKQIHESPRSFFK